MCLNTCPCEAPAPGTELLCQAGAHTQGWTMTLTRARACNTAAKNQLLSPSSSLGSQIFCWEEYFLLQHGCRAGCHLCSPSGEAALKRGCHFEELILPIGKPVKILVGIVLPRRAMETCRDPGFLSGGMQMRAIHEFGVFGLV